MAWVPGTSASSTDIGSNFRWWSGREEDYGEPFHIYRGVTQGYPLLTTIFNVVVDAVVCHWESFVA